MGLRGSVYNDRHKIGRYNVNLNSSDKHSDVCPHPFKPAADLSHFFVITPISNSARYKRRFELYWKFAEKVQEAGVKLITVEQAFGARPHMVTQSDDPHDVQVRSVEELWHKENLINLGIKRALELDPYAREVAWVDADCFPMLPYREWFEETWHALQHYEFVQMWKYLINFGPNHEPVSSPQLSFMATYAAAGFTVPESRTLTGNHTLAGWGPAAEKYGSSLAFGRPGLAWAANVSAINAVGGLIDKCILGSGDWHMAHGLVGAMKRWSGEFTKLPPYSQYLLDWQEKAERWIKRDVGFVDTTVGHWWHGNKKDRKYGDRGQILIKNQYNPFSDVKYDSQGMLQLETWDPRQIVLRDQIRAYMASRHEDSIDVF